MQMVLAEFDICSVAVVSNCTNAIIACPNPAEKVITISGLNGINQLMVVDAAGKTVISQKTANAIEKILTSITHRVLSYQSFL